MKQKIITLFVVVLIAGLLSLVVIVSNNKEKASAAKKLEAIQKSSEPIFYYGNTCPHCEIVEEWFKANQIEEKIQISKKEVYDNRANAAELSRAAESCGLDTSSIGVPFLYAEGQCLIGSPDIIEYFSLKLGIDENQASESAE